LVSVAPKKWRLSHGQNILYPAHTYTCHYIYMFLSWMSSKKAVIFTASFARIFTASLSCLIELQPLFPPADGVLGSSSLALPTRNTLRNPSTSGTRGQVARYATTLSRSGRRLGPGPCVICTRADREVAGPEEADVLVME
jgi:hypothetical protein